MPRQETMSSSCSSRLLEVRMHLRQASLRDLFNNLHLHVVREMA